MGQFRNQANMEWDLQVDMLRLLTVTEPRIGNRVLEDPVPLSLTSAIPADCFDLLWAQSRGIAPFLTDGAFADFESGFGHSQTVLRSLIGRSIPAIEEVRHAWRARDRVSRFSGCRQYVGFYSLPSVSNGSADPHRCCVG